MITNKNELKTTIIRLLKKYDTPVICFTEHTHSTYTHKERLKVDGWGLIYKANPS